MASESKGPSEGERPRVFDNLNNVRRLTFGFFIFCAILLLGDLVVHRHHSFAEGMLPIEGWFGYYAVYGFLAYTAIVLVSILLRKLVMRSEDYYDG